MERSEMTLTPQDATILVLGMEELPIINLAGFDPDFGICEYAWGDPVSHAGAPWQDHQYHTEVLSWHYHDYLGTHAYVQVWDYAQQSNPGQRWQYMLLLHRPSRQTTADGLIAGSTWEWTIRREYEAREGQHAPSHVEVAIDIDAWLAAPDILRFLIE